MLAKNPCAFLVFAFVFTQSSWFWSSFFFSSRFFFLHAFFPKHMHTKKARGAHKRSNQCAAPSGSRLQTSTSKRWGGGFLTTCDFLILLGCVQRPKAHPRFTPPCLSGTADSWDFYMIFPPKKHRGKNLIGKYVFKKWVGWWGTQGISIWFFRRKSIGGNNLIGKYVFKKWVGDGAHRGFLYDFSAEKA